MQKTCNNCTKVFEIEQDDLLFYKEMDVPVPTQCPTCRHQRRLLHVNQVHLYKRTCDATGKGVISCYPPESSYTVYDQEFWYGNEWSGTDYGRDYDFSKPFFKQFSELSKQVPRPCVFTGYRYDENSEYTNFAGKNRNCYLIFDSDENQDSYYMYGVGNSKNSVDCLRSMDLERCYEVIDSKNCYDCSYVQNSENCFNSMFLSNCVNVKNCIMCNNLRQKEYYFQNKPVSKERFEQIKQALKKRLVRERAIQQYLKWKVQFPQKHMQGLKNENSTGNYLSNTKNAKHCFDSVKIHDGKYCYQIFDTAKDCMDIDECGEIEKGYENHCAIYNAYNVRFSIMCYDNISNIDYSIMCFRSSNLFGCVGLKNKKYCILNKQYTKEEYEALVPKIIEHMKSTGEWGEFFPSFISPFGYNLTKAQDYYPLSKNEALQKGYDWRDDDRREFQPATCVVPDSIDEVSSDISNELLACDTCKKNYKIIPQELAFYKEKGIPLPKKCFHCRHKNRMSQRNNSRKLFERKCEKCMEVVKTAYSEERPEKIYCEGCYHKEIL